MRAMTSAEGDKEQTYSRFFKPFAAAYRVIWRGFTEKELP